MAPPFPSPLERTVASALLLLSEADRPPSFDSPQFDFDGELLLKSKSSSNEESVSMISSGGSKRCASSVTNEDGSSLEIRAHKMRIIAVFARLHEKKLNVKRKSRSKIGRKLKAGKPLPPPSTKKTISFESLSTEAGSCLSSSTSVVSSTRSCNVSPEERKKAVVTRAKPRRKTRGGSASAHIQRRAEAILKLLSSGGCSSEVKIRRMLGDSPDTSKALRMLLKTDEVKRSGTGGRRDPYIYRIA